MTELSTCEALIIPSIHYLEVNVTIHASHYEHRAAPEPSYKGAFRLLMISLCQLVGTHSAVDLLIRLTACLRFTEINVMAGVKSYCPMLGRWCDRSWSGASSIVKYHAAVFNVLLCIEKRVPLFPWLVEFGLISFEWHGRPPKPGNGSGNEGSLLWSSK